MTDPYRTPADLIPSEPPTPPPPYPGPEKWKNPLWLGFFNIALGAVSANVTDYRKKAADDWIDPVRGPGAPVRLLVNDAEVIADEAWRRASGAGHPAANRTLSPGVSTP